MSSPQYTALDVPGNSALELEEYGSDYRPSGLYAGVSATSLISEHDIGPEPYHQHEPNTASMDHVRPPVIHTETFAASPTPEPVFGTHHGFTSQHNSTSQSGYTLQSGLTPQPGFTSQHGFAAEGGSAAEYDYQQDIDVDPHGRPLRRFYFRTIVGALGPVIVVCYLIVIWRIYLAPVDSNSPTSFGPSGAQWVFYSWFVAGVIGLNLSLYGLAGAEAGMLMEPIWKVSDAMRLMLHADGTWSGPGGWMKALKWIVQMRRTKQQRSNLPGRLWFILALPSVVVFTAWPLSGLCLEMTSGFLHGTPGTGASVTGFIYSDFNANPGGRKPTRGSFPDARILGFGAAYTLEGTDRSKSEYLQTVPVILPNSEGVEEIFLTAQSETPIEGRAWGLLLHYDCSIVSKPSDLRLLKDRRSTMELWGSSSAIPKFGTEEENLEKKAFFAQSSDAVADLSLDDTDAPINILPQSTAIPTNLFPEPEDDIPPAVQWGDQFSEKYKSYRLHDNATLVQVRKEPRGQWEGVLNLSGQNQSLSIDAVIETAYESWPVPDTSEPEDACNLPSDTTNNSATAYCYYNINGNMTDSYPGIERKRIFEVLLWQSIDTEGGWGNSKFNASLFNLTIDHNITDLYGEYTGLRTGFDTGTDDDFYQEGEGLTAIGVSCSSSSSVGTADIDGVRSTFSNYVRIDSPIPARKGDCARRLGAETLACTLDLNNDGWLRWLFDSIGAPPPLDKSDSDNLLGFGDYRENVQLAYLQAAQLRQSLLQTFSNYAITLMYNDGRDFIGADGSRLRTLNPNATTFVAGTVIAPGVMPPSIPVALFGLWALISSTLCLVYGFRRRWSAILDGHTVFRLGVELMNSYKTKLQQHSTTAEIEECSALHEIPGFVGDMGHSSPVGRIGLVEGKVNEVAAKKDKFYQ